LKKKKRVLEYIEIVERKNLWELTQKESFRFRIYWELERKFSVLRNIWELTQKESSRFKIYWDSWKKYI